MNCSVDGDNRCKPAGTETGNCLNSEVQIIGRLFGFRKPEKLAQTVENRDGATDMAGCAVAAADDILSFCFEGEVFIEGGCTVQARLSYAD